MPFEVGNTVRVKGSKEEGTIIEIKSSGNVTVSISPNMETTIHESLLELVSDIFNNKEDSGTP